MYFLWLKGEVGLEASVQHEPDKENKHERKNPEKEIHTFMEKRFCFQSHPPLTAFIWFSLAAEN